MKTMAWKFWGLCAKSFGDSAKNLCFLRFHNGGRNVFVIESVGNGIFIFLITLSKQVHMGRKFERALKSSKPFILKHIFIYLTYRIQVV